MEQQIEALLRGSQFKQILENYIKSLRATYGLKRTEIEILYYLSHCGERNTAKDIRLSLYMNKGHISQTTDSLRQKGYISSSRDENDYRIVHYTITDEAKSLTTEIDEAIVKLYDALFDGVSPEDMETLKRVAGKLAGNISDILENQ